MRRGDVFWFHPNPVRGSEQAGRRPAIVVSRNSINRASPVVLVVPLTTFRGQHLYPSDVLIRAPEGGVKQDSVAMGLQLRAIDKERLGPRVGSLTSAALRKVELAILRVLDIQAGE